MINHKVYKHCYGYMNFIVHCNQYPLNTFIQVLYGQLPPDDSTFFVLKQYDGRNVLDLSSSNLLPSGGSPYYGRKRCPSSSLSHKSNAQKIDEPEHFVAKCENFDNSDDCKCVGVDALIGVCKTTSKEIALSVKKCTPKNRLKHLNSVENQSKNLNNRPIVLDTEMTNTATPVTFSVTNVNPVDGNHTTSSSGMLF